MSRLKLVEQNSGFSIKNKGNDTAEIIIYGQIGKDWTGDGISAKDIDAELKKLPSTIKNLTIRINSVGGDVFDGLTIYNRLKQHTAKKTVYVDGIAASIASVIMLAGDEVVMSTGALIMVHLPMTFAYGNRVQMDETIDTLITVEDQLITVYNKRMKNKSRGEIRKLLEANNAQGTWFSAEEAMDNGLADREAETALPIAACLVDKAKWLNQKPATLLTDKEAAKKRATEVKNKIGSFLARNK